MKWQWEKESSKHYVSCWQWHIAITYRLWWRETPAWFSYIFLHYISTATHHTHNDILYYIFSLYLLHVCFHLYICAYPIFRTKRNSINTENYSTMLSLPNSGRAEPSATSIDILSGLGSQAAVARIILNHEELSKKAESWEYEIYSSSLPALKKQYNI